MESIVLIGFMGAGKTTIGQSFMENVRRVQVIRPIARQKKLSMKFCNN